MKSVKRVKKFIIASFIFMAVPCLGQRTAYVANHSNSRIYIIDVSGRSVIDSPEVGSRVRSLFLDEYSIPKKLYATTVTSSTGDIGMVLRMNTDGSNIDTILLQRKVFASAYDYQNSMLYYVEKETHKVCRIDISGSLPVDLINAECLDSPLGALEPTDIELEFIGSDVVLYVGFNGNNSGLFEDQGVYKTGSFSRTSTGALNGSSWIQLVSMSKGAQHIRGITLDIAKGFLYFSEGGTEQIYRFSTSGNITSVSSLVAYLPIAEKVDGLDVDVTNSKLVFVHHNSNNDVLKEGDLDISTTSVVPIYTRLDNSTDIEMEVSNPLPVELVGFDVVKVNHEVHLTWFTETEVNNHFFKVQRSSDGVKYDSIGMKKGQGSKMGETNYEFVDSRPLQGCSYYRLVQVDFNEAQTYHKVRSVGCNEDLNEFHVYPNPVSKSGVFLTIPEKYRNQELNVTITDPTGKQVHDLSLSGQSLIKLVPNGGYPIKGIYTVHISVNNKEYTKKILISK